MRWRLASCSPLYGGEGDATLGVGLRIKENLNMDHTLLVRFTQISFRQSVEIIGVAQDAGACPLGILRGAVDGAVGDDDDVEAGVEGEQLPDPPAFARRLAMLLERGLPQAA